MRDVRVVLAVAAMLVAAGPTFGQTQTDFIGVAKAVAPKIRDKIAAKFTGQTCEVAVFQPGDRDGRVTVDIFQSSQYLQGELIFQLKSLSNDRYLVHDKSSLQKKFSAARIDSSGIDSSSPAKTAVVLRKIGIDAAVIGTIDAISQKSIVPGTQKINVSLLVVFADGTFAQFTEAIATGINGNEIIPTVTTYSSGRFIVQISMKIGNRWQELPLIKKGLNGHEYYLELPDDIDFSSVEAQYKIRITNRGSPAVKFINAREEARLYGVAVLIDGVNSIFEDQGDGKIGPVGRHPDKVKKWILTGPNHKMVMDSTRSTGFRLERTSDGGTPFIEIPGFQTNGETAAAFTFASASESIAESIGITAEIGIIAIHFYGEELSGDRVDDDARLAMGDKGVRPSPSSPRAPLSDEPKLKANNGGLGLDPPADSPSKSPADSPSKSPGEKPATVGTKAGQSVPSGVIQVKPNLRPEAVESWRILYRKKREIPIPVDDRVPVIKISK